MKKLVLASLSTVLMTVGSVAFAIDAAPPAPPTGTTASPAPDAVRAARQQERAKMKTEHSGMVTKVKAACSAEIQVTGCSQDLGKGLLNCIREYKKSHKEFSISKSCKAAKRDGREMRQEHKAERSKMKAAAPAKAAPAASSDNH